MMAAILNSAMLYSATAILDTDTLLSSLGITQKHSHFTLTQTNSIGLKFIHSHSTLWWQPSWILPCWIQTLPSWIQKPCFILSDSLQNTLTPLWLWLKLIQSDSNSALLGFPLKLAYTCQDWFPPFTQKNFTHSFWLNLKMAAILKSAIFYSAIFHKKNFTYSFLLNVMMTAILNSAILDSDTLFSFLRFTQ